MGANAQMKQCSDCSGARVGVNIRAIIRGYEAELELTRLRGEDPSSLIHRASSVKGYVCNRCGRVFLYADDVKLFLS